MIYGHPSLMGSTNMIHARQIDWEDLSATFFLLRDTVCIIWSEEEESV